MGFVGFRCQSLLPAITFIGTAIECALFVQHHENFCHTSNAPIIT